MLAETPGKYHFSFEEWDREYGVEKENDYKIFFYRLSQFFRNRDNFPFPEMKLYCPGTAPEIDSEIPRILYATDFDEATLVDPRYAHRKTLDKDLLAIMQIADGGVLKCDWTEINSDSLLEKYSVYFTIRGKQRKVTFIAGDATVRGNIPEYNVFFSGARVCGQEVGESYHGLFRASLPLIVSKLAPGGFFVPDHDLARDDDEKCFIFRWRRYYWKYWQQLG